MYRITEDLFRTGQAKSKYTIQKKFHAGSQVFYKAYNLNYKLVITSSEPYIKGYI